MSEHENELKKALAENGDVDAEKAKQTAAEAVLRFSRGLKWTERWGLIFLLLCIAVFEFALIKFALAYTTKSMIGYAIVMLLSYGIGVMVALFSGITSMLLRVMKEIKQSQLERLGYPAERNLSPSAGMVPFLVRSRALSRVEIVGWTLATIIIAVTVAVATRRLPDRVWLSDMAHFEGAPVTLDAPRIGAPVHVHIYLRMDQGVCRVSRVTPEHKQSEMFWMGKGSWHSQLPPGDSLRLDPQGNSGEYWVRFE